MKSTNAAKHSQKTGEQMPEAAQEVKTSTAQTPSVASEEQLGVGTQADPAAELLGQLQRLQAEFNNYRRRADADVASAIERGRDKTVRELLPVLDSFVMARGHASTAKAVPVAGNPHKPVASSEESELSKGLTLIHNQLKKLLEEWQVSEIPTEGLVDTKLHEVYITETVKDKPAGTILQVLQLGYVRNGTVLRTAKVKAARN